MAKHYRCAQLAELERSRGLVVPAIEARAGYHDRTDFGAPPPAPVLQADLSAIRPVTVERVAASLRDQWSAMMAAYHPLGFRRAFGAHLRYFVRGQVAASG